MAERRARQRDDGGIAVFDPADGGRVVVDAAVQVQSEHDVQLRVALEHGARVRYEIGEVLPAAAGVDEQRAQVTGASHRRDGCDVRVAPHRAVGGPPLVGNVDDLVLVERSPARRRGYPAGHDGAQHGGIGAAARGRARGGRRGGGDGDLFLGDVLRLHDVDEAGHGFAVLRIGEYPHRVRTALRDAGLGIGVVVISIDAAHPELLALGVVELAVQYEETVAGVVGRARRRSARRTRIASARVEMATARVDGPTARVDVVTARVDVVTA